MAMEWLHVKTIWISAVVSALAAAPIGWLASSFEMGQTLAVDTVKIAVMQKDIETLQREPRISREEFTHMQKEEDAHWAEQHDFFVRQDQRADAIIREHARIVAMFESRKNESAGHAKNHPDP